MLQRLLRRPAKVASATNSISTANTLALVVGAPSDAFMNTTASSSSNAPFRPTALRLEKSKRFKHLNPLTPDNAINPLGKPLELDKSALHVVSSPIGNVKDYTIRALEVLRQCDYIVCTNRNATKALLNIVDIDFAGRLVQLQSAESAALTQTASSSSGAVNSASFIDAVGVSTQRIVDMLKGGRSMALVSPSGTPCIGDNGVELVKACLINGVRVVSVPGASGVASALSISGANVMNSAMMATTTMNDTTRVNVTYAKKKNTNGGDHDDDGNSGADDTVTKTCLMVTSNSAPVGMTAFAEGSFFFGGMLSDKAGVRARQLRQVRDFSCPVIFYDTPKRLVATLTDMTAIFDRKVGDTSKNIGGGDVADAMLMDGFEGGDGDAASFYDGGETGADESGGIHLISRNRNNRRPRRVTVVHEVTKFNESTHSGSATALMRYYSQMGRSTKLTEVGQCMIIVDGVIAPDLVAEEEGMKTQIQNFQLKASGGAPLLNTSSSSTRPTVGRVTRPAHESAYSANVAGSPFFKSGLFGGNKTTASTSPSNSPRSTSTNATSEPDAEAQRLRAIRVENRRKRMAKLEQRLIKKIQLKQAKLEARMLVEKEAVRRHYEDDSKKPLA